MMSAVTAAAWQITPTAPPPPDRATWEASRPHIRQCLRDALGEWPPLPPPRVERRPASAPRLPGVEVTRLSWDNGMGQTVPSYLLLPTHRIRPLPAIYFCHAHGGRYALGKDELFEATALGPTKAELLVRSGYAVIAPDTWCFGERQGRGPGGPDQRGADEEVSEFKRQLWLGRTLFGLMVRDDLLGLRVARSLPEVDPARVGVVGMSMGCTRAWWAAALDDSVAAAVCVACLTRYQDLVASGAMDAHGIYYFIPGLLRHFDTEAIVGLIAPRPLLTLSGDQDRGAPASGVRKIQSWCEALWGVHAAGDHYRGRLYAGVGHEWTGPMWEESLTWLARWLGGRPPD